MKDEKGYNGWSNYETWCAHLWLTNEQASDAYWRDRAAFAWDDAGVNGKENSPHLTRSECARFTLADTLKSEIEAAAEAALPDSGLATDLLNAAVSEINWDELADAFLDELPGYERA